MTNQLILGDCLEEMPKIPDKSIDMILCDLPYAMLEDQKWDSIIPFDKLWKQYERIIKDQSAIVLTASQPFTSHLILSNLNLFKYEWIWEKDYGTNFHHAKNSPLKIHESVCVFSKGNIVHAGHENRMNYFPQDLRRVNERSRGTRKSGHRRFERPSNKQSYMREYSNYPNSIIFSKLERGLHPTQKPVELFEYLIKTYTLEGDTVLDNCVGSGTTAIACINTKRNYICMEKCDKYYEVAKNRIEKHLKEKEATKWIDDVLNSV